MKLPEEFVAYTRSMMGEPLWNQYVEALEQPPLTSIRVNRSKLQNGQCCAESIGSVPWCKEGFYLNSRPNFTFDPLLHAGAYYVQEASSMFLCHVLRQLVDKPVVMLDMCAAPGGKSTAARSVLPEGSLLISNEPMRQRCQVLAENMQKWGHPDVVVTQNYPADYRQSGLLFDVILCDVPCSGEGMFRKEDEALAQWSPALVRQCSELQRQIVADAWACLKPGGILIYSTCTLNTLENEENVQHFEQELGAEVLPIVVQAGWNITGSLLKGWEKPVCRFIPGRTKGEGLFMAAMRKSGEAEVSSKPEKKRKNANTSFTTRKRRVYDSEMTCLRSVNNMLAEMGNIRYAIQGQWEEICRQVAATLHPMLIGVTTAEQKGRDWVPCQSLALSSDLRRESFPQVELSYQQAISYLRKESFALPEGTPRGFVLVTFQQLPLGFMKNIGNRANNLYPQEWRIRSTYLPDDARPLFNYHK